MSRPLSAILVSLAVAGCINPYTFGRQQPVREPRPAFFAPTAIDALANGYLAQRFPGLDGIDRRRAAEAMVASLENGRDGQPNPWRNPDSRNNGEVVPGASFSQAGNQRCRAFRHTAYTRGQPTTAAGTACRGADGVWSVVG
jgi:surface antigen